MHEVVIMEPLRKDLLFMACLRQNSREKLTRISKRTRIPVTTLFDRLRLLERDVIVKHTSILNFEKLGYHCKASILFRVGKEHRELLKDLLIGSEHVNSVYKINNGYDYIVDVIFRDMRELNEYVEEIEKKVEILDKQVYFILQELCQEKFLSDTLDFR